MSAAHKTFQRHFASSNKKGNELHACTYVLTYSGDGSGDDGCVCGDDGDEW